MEYKLDIKASNDEVLNMLGELMKLEIIKIIVNSDDMDNETKARVVKTILDSDVESKETIKKTGDSKVELGR